MLRRPDAFDLSGPFRQKLANPADPAPPTLFRGVLTCSSKGVIPREAAHGYRHRKPKREQGQEGEGDAAAGDKREDKEESKIDESDDEDVDMAALKRGELEG